MRKQSIAKPKKQFRNAAGIAAAFTVLGLVSLPAQRPGQQAGSSPRDREPTWLQTPIVKGDHLSCETFESEIAGEKVSYVIYLPPGYEDSGERCYPVLYWLHRIGGSQEGVPLMTERVSDAIEAEMTPAMIFVFVNGMIRSSWVDSFDGKVPVESVAIKELIPLIDEKYSTIPTREGRMIEGFSMGGGGAAKWGFRHPDLFGSISIIDGALHSSEQISGPLAQSFETVYGGDMEYFRARDPWVVSVTNADKVKGRTPIRIVTRTTGLGEANRKFHEHLESLGIENEFHAIPDAPHSPNPLYEKLGKDNWEFYRRAFAVAVEKR